MLTQEEAVMAARYEAQTQAKAVADLDAAGAAAIRNNGDVLARVFVADRPARRADLGTCRSLDDAMNRARTALLTDPYPLDSEAVQAQLERLDRAEHLYQVHYYQYLTDLEAVVHAHVVEAFRLAGLPEFAAALETGQWDRIGEGRP